MTTCKGCIFAEIENYSIPGVLTLMPLYRQCGCRLGRLDKFRERGAAVTPPSGRAREHFEIDRSCNAKILREAGISPEEAQARLREHVGLGFAAVVLLDGDLERASLEGTLSSLLRSSIRPQAIIAIGDDPEGCDAAAAWLGANSPCHWRVHRILADRAEQGDYKSPRRRAIDAEVAALRGRPVDYYALLSPGVEVAADLFERMEVAVNDELRALPFVRDETHRRGGVKVVQVGAHLALDGFRGRTLWTKFALAGIRPEAV